MKSRVILPLLSLAALLAPSPALAWGKTGHRVAAAIAEDTVSGATRAHIRTILGTETLEEASTWPDEMRSSPDPFWATATPWHYVTVEGAHYDHAPAEGDAVTALDRFRAILRDPASSLEQKQLALRFIVHIVADLHQPLHTGNGTDRGGNDVKVAWFGQPTNLHTVWDSKLVDEEQLAFSEMADRLQRRMTPQQVIAWWNSDPMVWIGESTAIRDTIYPAEPSLSYDYIYRHTPVVKQRLAQAGIRLAAYLDGVFSAQGTTTAGE
ncbi:S1/P1 nuclease [Altericroceibacterium xinjiangense]|uniref:S1/P1 nuclease n=1 Tax=Altericroceibacterium xinjiangense TaxID=762261 RepID=UPI000F7F482E|nr:S1/P1 nuclease [Altericroceibacterium xinjiangense]